MKNTTQLYFLAALTMLFSNITATAAILPDNFKPNRPYGSNSNALSVMNDGVACLTIFYDIDADGMYDEDEFGIEGIEILMIEAPETEGTPLPFAIPTDNTGTACFTDLDYGLYTFQVDVPQGWEFNGNPFITIEIAPDTEPYYVAYSNALSGPSFSKAGFIAYPNPATTSVTFKTNGFTEGGEIVISDISGKQLLQKKVEGSAISVDVQDFSAGIYLAQIKSGSKVETVKFVVAD